MEKLKQGFWWPHQKRKMWQSFQLKFLCFILCHMFMKMAFRLMHFVKMESLAIYEGKSPSGRIWWDICDCAECRKEETLEEDYLRRRKKKSTQQIFKERYEVGDPEVNLLGEPSRKFDQGFEIQTVRSDQKNREALSFAVFLASKIVLWEKSRIHTNRSQTVRFWKLWTVSAVLTDPSF